MVFRNLVLETGGAISEYETLKKIFGRKPNSKSFIQYIKKSFI
jgi:Zn-dependent oligopeptidase